MQNTSRLTEYLPPKDNMLNQVRTALNKTKSHPVSGPDRISWRLLRSIRNTSLGKGVLEDVAQMAEVRNRYYGE